MFGLWSLDFDLWTSMFGLYLFQRPKTRAHPKSNAQRPKHEDLSPNPEDQSSKIEAQRSKPKDKINMDFSIDLWASSFGLWASIFGLRSLVFRLWDSVFGLRSSGFGLRALGFGLWSALAGLVLLALKYSLSTDLVTVYRRTDGRMRARVTTVVLLCSTWLQSPLSCKAPPFSHKGNAKEISEGALCETYNHPRTLSSGLL